MKKILALVISLAMLLSMIPMQALAYSGESGTLTKVEKDASNVTYTISDGDYTLEVAFTEIAAQYLKYGLKLTEFPTGSNGRKMHVYYREVGTDTWTADDPASLSGNTGYEPTFKGGYAAGTNYEYCFIYTDSSSPSKVNDPNELTGVLATFEGESAENNLEITTLDDDVHFRFVGTPTTTRKGFTAKITYTGKPTWPGNPYVYCKGETDTDWIKAGQTDRFGNSMTTLNFNGLKAGTTYTAKLCSGDPANSSTTVYDTTTFTTEPFPGWTFNGCTVNTTAGTATITASISGYQGTYSNQYMGLVTTYTDRYGRLIDGKNNSTQSAAVRAGGAIGSDGSATASVTLTGLEPGKEYTILYYITDERNYYRDNYVRNEGTLTFTTAATSEVSADDITITPTEVTYNKEDIGIEVNKADIPSTRALVYTKKKTDVNYAYKGYVDLTKEGDKYTGTFEVTALSVNTEYDVRVVLDATEKTTSFTTLDANEVPSLTVTPLNAGCSFVYSLDKDSIEEGAEYRALARYWQEEHNQWVNVPYNSYASGTQYEGSYVKLNASNEYTLTAIIKEREPATAGQKVIVTLYDKNYTRLKETTEEYTTATPTLTAAPDANSSKLYSITPKITSSADDGSGPAYNVPIYVFYREKVAEGQTEKEWLPSGTGYDAYAKVTIGRDSDTFTKTISGLKPGTDYEIQLRLKSASGPVCGSGIVSTADDAREVSASHSEVSYASAKVSAELTGNTTLEKSSVYCLYRPKAMPSKMPGAWQSKKISDISTETGSGTVDLTGLAPNTEYEYKTIIGSPEAIEKESAVSSFTTEDLASQIEIENVEMTPSYYYVDMCGEIAGEPDGVNLYMYYYIKIDGQWKSVYSHGVSSRNQISYWGLEPGKTYEYDVEVKTDSDNTTHGSGVVKSLSEPGEFTTLVPSEKTLLNIERDCDSLGFDLTMTEPSTEEGVRYEAYVYIYHIVPESEYREFVGDYNHKLNSGNDYSAFFEQEGLDSDTEYEIEVYVDRITDSEDPEGEPWYDTVYYKELSITTDKLEAKMTAVPKQMKDMAGASITAVTPEGYSGDVYALCELYQNGQPVKDGYGNNVTLGESLYKKGNVHTGGVAFPECALGTYEIRITAYRNWNDLYNEENPIGYTSLITTVNDNVPLSGTLDVDAWYKSAYFMAEFNGEIDYDATDTAKLFYREKSADGQQEKAWECSTDEDIVNGSANTREFELEELEGDTQYEAYAQCEIYGKTVKTAVTEFTVIGDAYIASRQIALSLASVVYVDNYPDPPTLVALLRLDTDFGYLGLGYQFGYKDLSDPNGEIIWEENATGEISENVTMSTMLYDENYQFWARIIDYDYNVVRDGISLKNKQNILVDSTNITKSLGAGAFNLGAKAKGNASMTYTSSDPAVAAVDSSGKVTLKKAGKAVITINAAENDRYTSATKKVTIIVKPKAPTSVTSNLYAYNAVKTSWKAVPGATGYKVYYKKSTAKSYTYLTTTAKTYVNKSKLSAGAKYYFKVVPYTKIDGKTYTSSTYKTAYTYTLKKVSTPVVSKYSKSYVKVKWTNISGESGYQISKSTKKTGTSIVSTYKTTSGKYKKISAKKGKTYYYKVRAYKTVSGKKIYGPWSSVRAYKLK